LISPHFPSAAATAIRVMHPWLISACQVGHASLVAPPKSIPVRFPLLGRKTRMTIFVAVVGVRLAVIVKILLRANTPIAKTAPLYILQLLRRCIPAAAILPISLCGCSRGRTVCAAHTHACNSQDERNCRNR
jgi:hypothetical protein